DYSIGSAFQKSLDVFPRKLLRDLELSRVSVQGATTHLPIRFNQSAAVASKHALGCSIRLAKESLHHTPAKHRNAQVVFFSRLLVRSSFASRDSRATSKQERQRKASSSAHES